jgi:hypothetical protein
MSLRVTTLGAREKIVVTQKRPSQPSLPSEGWGLGVRVDCTYAESPLRKAVKGDSARKVLIFKLL